MLIIFGWGHRTTDERGPTLPLACPNCGNEVWFHLLSYKTWFTLVFIPVVPYESKTLLLCSVCSRGVELDGDQVQKARELNVLAKDLMEKRISESAFLAAVQKIKLLD